MKQPKSNHVFRFTKSKLEEVKPPSSGITVLHDTEKSTLKAHVTPKGKIVFYYRNTVNGNAHREAIGDYGIITIDQARRGATAIELKHSSGMLLSTDDQAINNDIKFNDGFHEFMERYSKKEKRSWMDDEREIKLHVRQWFDRKMTSITKYDVQALVEHIADNSGKTQANHIIERISAIYNKLIDWGYKLTNPTSGVKKYKLTKRTRFLTAEELPRFWEILDDYEHTDIPDIVKIALFTGARKSNILSMRWLEVDWDRKVWNIPMTKNGDPHTVPLSEELVCILRSRQTNQLLMHKQSKWVFPSNVSKSGHVEDIKKTWLKLLQSINIQGFHFHDLRHTYASYQAMNGSSLKLIGATLGHKSMQSTDRYAQLADYAIRKSSNDGIELILSKINR